jgi:hypothetical protein
LASIPASDSDHGRALALLADAPNGMTEAALMAHGVTSRTIADLVNAGYANESLDHVLVDDRPAEVIRVRISKAGRQARR